MDQVRLGMIGCGGMARNHMQHFDSIEGLNFTAAADVDENCRKLVADTYGVRTFEDGQDLIDSGEIDAVFIATPHYFHPPLAIAAFEKGLHVLVEKPLAVTAKAAQEMIDAAEARPDLVFAAMFQMRVHPMWRQVKRLIDQGRVGKLLRANWNITTWFRSQAYYDSGGWRATWKGEGGGVLLNQCPHNLDMLTWLVGSPSRVTAQVGIGKYHHIEVEDEVNALLEFDNGATGTFVTNTAEAPGINRLEIVGDRGTIIAEQDQSLVLLENDVPALEHLKTTTGCMGRPASHRYDITPGGENGGHRAITENFVNAILKGEPVIAPGAEGLLGLELGNAMLMSGIQHKPIDIPMDRDAYDALLQELIEKSTFQKKQPAGAGA